MTPSSINNHPHQSIYWSHFTPGEKQMLASHPPDQVNHEIALLRVEIAAVLEMSRNQPSTSPDDSLPALYTISIAATTIASLVRFRRGHDHDHDQSTETIHQAHHLAFLQTGSYRLMSAMGFSVPDGVLRIQPDLLPAPDLIVSDLKTDPPDG